MNSLIVLLRTIHRGREVEGSVEAENDQITSNLCKCSLIFAKGTD